MPSPAAAVVPISAQSAGTTRSPRGTGGTAQSSRPKVSMVVGQGTPKVGAAG